MTAVIELSGGRKVRRKLGDPDIGPARDKLTSLNREIRRAMGIATALLESDRAQRVAIWIDARKQLHVRRPTYMADRAALGLDLVNVYWRIEERQLRADIEEALLRARWGAA